MNALVSTWLLSRPYRVTAIGRVLYRFAAFEVAAGVAAQLLTSAMRRLDPQAGYRWIADVLPYLPTWWIPETVLGMIVVTTLGAIGLAIAHGGRRHEREWVQAQIG